MDDDNLFSNLIKFLCVQVRSGMALVYGCRVPLFEQEWEHYILVGATNSSLGVGRHSHVQLGVRCTLLVVPYTMRWLLEDW
jgi:hypothetical protein